MLEQQPFETLELEYSKWCEVPSECCVAVSSGTSALHIACEVLKTYTGSKSLKIAVPDYTMVAVPRAVTLAGCEPLFVDITEDDLCMDMSKLPPVYDAMIGVDTYGCWQTYKPDMTDELFIQDLSESHGTMPHRHCFAACWSFYKNKIVHGEEGGMIMFRDPEHGKLARMLRSLGFTDAHDYTHIPRGINARMSNSHATQILESFYDMENNLNARLDRALDYDRIFCSDGFGIDTVCSPTNLRACISQSNWVYPVRVVGMTYAQQHTVVSHIQSAGIAARYGFKPMSSQQEYLDLQCRQNNTITYKVAPEIFYLPVSETMTAEDAQRIGELTMKIVKETIDTCS
jgi:dTDP-4-amino-4,6-dideoxygalactose transaminase